MSLINELKAKSNGVEQVKKEIIEEIKQFFDEYFKSDDFEKDLRKWICEDEIKNRKVRLDVKFWEYHEGCSTTHFNCLGKKWFNPENKDGYQSHKYKGVELCNIDKEVGLYISHRLEEKMLELGFELLYTESRKSRFDYYEKDHYFGW